MQPVRFKLDLRFLLAKNACGPGSHQAMELFALGRSYSLAEIEAAGADGKNVQWLIEKHAEDNPEILALVRQWAAVCADEAGIKAKRPRDYKACVALVRDAMRSRIRNGMRVKDARAWSHARLVKTFSHNEG